MTVSAITGLRVAAIRLPFGIPLAVVHHEQVEPAVIVVVEPARRDRPWLGAPLAIRAGSPRDVFECAVPPVAEQQVSVDSRHEQIRPAVVIEIPRRDSHAVSLAPNAGPFRHVAKSSIPVVPVQTIPV